MLASIGSGPQKVLDAVTANGSGSYDFGNLHSTAGLQVILTGAPSGGTIVITGSIDGVTYDAAALATFTIGTDASGAIKIATGTMFRSLKATLGSLSGGTNPTVTAWVGAY